MIKGRASAKTAKKRQTDLILIIAGAPPFLKLCNYNIYCRIMQKNSVPVQGIKNIDKKPMNKYNNDVCSEESDFQIIEKQECGLLDEAYNQE